MAIVLKLQVVRMSRAFNTFFSYAIFVLHTFLLDIIYRLFLVVFHALIALRAASEQLHQVKRMKPSRPHLSMHTNKNGF